MAIQTLYLPSDPWYLTLHPLYLCHQTQGINYTPSTLCMISQTLYLWHHIQYACYHSNCLWHYTPLCITSHPVYLTSYPICTLSPYCFHDNTTPIPDISPTIFDITATLSVSSHRWHTHLYLCITLSMTSQQVCKSSHLTHIWHFTESTSHHIRTLWHQCSWFMTSQTLHSWHQTSSIWHHIHSLGHHTTFCMTSSPLYLTSRPLYLCHHSHPIDDITATIWMVSQPVYLWHHIPYI